LQTGETGETRFLKEALAADVMKMSASIIADRRNGRDTFSEGGSGRLVIKKSAQVDGNRFERLGRCAEFAAGGQLAKSSPVLFTGT
jgi:hypothetical protein